MAPKLPWESTSAEPTDEQKGKPVCNCPMCDCEAEVKQVGDVCHNCRRGHHVYDSGRYFSAVFGKMRK